MAELQHNLKFNLVMVKDKFMKVICIIGLPGSGKTTTSQLFSQNLQNATYIDVDALTFNSVVHFAKEFEEIFGVPANKENPLVSLLFAFETSTEQVEAFFNAVHPFVNEQLNQIIEEKRSENITFFIINYGEMSKMDIWKEADYRIHLATTQKRLEIFYRRENLLNISTYRPKYSNRFVTFAVKKTIANTTDIDYTIHNHFEMDNLIAEVKELSEKIMDSKRINRCLPPHIPIVNIKTRNIENLGVPPETDLG